MVDNKDMLGGSSKIHSDAYVDVQAATATHPRLLYLMSQERTEAIMQSVAREAFLPCSTPCLALLIYLIFLEGQGRSRPRE